MTTTYELYTNENGTPKAVEGKAPAIIERVEALEDTLDNGVVTSVNGQTGDVTVDVGVTSFNGSKGAVTYSAPVSSVNGQTGEVSIPTGHNVGEEWVSYTGKIPNGGVPYCGQTVTRATYADLWAYAQAQGLVKTESEWQSWASSHGGNVPYYSSGNGSTTFRMPKIVGYVKGATSQSESGAYVAEGLPNITGSFGSGSQSAFWSESGAFAKGNSYTGNGANSSGNMYVHFDASRSNPIYGNSDHVTPETSTVLFGVYAFGEITNQGALDAMTLATGLAHVESNVATLKNTKLENSTPHIIDSWSNGKNWYRKYSDGWIEQGGWQGASSTNTTVTLNTPFTTTNYTVTAVAYGGEGVPRIDSLTTTKFQWQPSGSSCTGYWYACGY